MQNRTVDSVEIRGGDNYLRIKIHPFKPPSLIYWLPAGVEVVALVLLQGQLCV